MSSRIDCYRRAPELRVRPVPELGHCLVFTPGRPRLFSLNAAAWLLLEMCEGQPVMALDAQFRAALREQCPCNTTVPDTFTLLEDLAVKGILVRQTFPEAAT